MSTETTAATTEPQEPKAPQGKPKKKKAGFASLLFPLLSLALLGVSIYLYWKRPDSAAALLVFPPWIWAMIGSFLALIGIFRRFKLASLVLLAWVGFTAWSSEDVRGWAFRRGQYPNPEWQQSPNKLRIVSLNCAGGSIEAAYEVKGFEPDIVLLQESPSSEELTKLGQELYGEEAAIMAGIDGSILARGQFQVKPMRAGVNDHVVGTLNLPDGRSITVVSLRLRPPIMEVGLWNPALWRRQQEDLQARRDQLRSIVSVAQALDPGTPLLVGGDFNAPGNGTALNVMPEQLKDAWNEAGIGWGNSITNDYPFERVDQVWLSKQFTPKTVKAFRSKHSDHRLIVCDVILPKQ